MSDSPSENAFFAFSGKLKPMFFVSGIGMRNGISGWIHKDTPPDYF
jgi:hypothetical protein